MEDTDRGDDKKDQVRLHSNAGRKLFISINMYNIAGKQMKR